MKELIRNFGVDWRLLAAQAANFLILLVLLKIFLYKPILETLRARKREIEKGLEFSQEAEEKLARVKEEREEKLREAERHALGIVGKAEGLAKERGQDIIDQASAKAEDLVLRAKEVIEEERTKMREEFSQKAQDLVRLGLTRVIGKIAEERDEKLIQEALRELTNVK